MKTTEHNRPGMITVWMPRNFRLVTTRGMVTWIEWLQDERERVLSKGTACEIVSTGSERTGKHTTSDGLVWGLCRVTGGPPR